VDSSDSLDALGRKSLVSAGELKESTALKIIKPAMPSELQCAAIYKLTKKPTRIYCLYSYYLYSRYNCMHSEKNQPQSWVNTERFQARKNSTPIICKINKLNQNLSCVCVCIGTAGLLPQSAHHFE
jgi:hypothetical protein